MKEQFEQFLRERRYLRNLSENTLTYYSNIHHIFDNEGVWDNLSKQGN
jgi:hypothetical protein